MVKDCSYCGKPMTVHHKGQKFCSPDCMSKYYQEHLELIPNEENAEKKIRELEEKLWKVKKELREQEKIYKKLKSELK